MDLIELHSTFFYNNRFPAEFLNSHILVFKHLSMTYWNALQIKIRKKHTTRIIIFTHRENLIFILFNAISVCGAKNQFHTSFPIITCRTSSPKVTTFDFISFSVLLLSHVANQLQILFPALFCFTSTK